MTVPLSYRTAPVKAAMTSGKTLVVGIGDSEMTQTASPRVFGGSIRSWALTRAGVFVPSVAVTYEGYGAPYITSGVTNTNVVPGVNFTDGVTCRNPMAARETLFGATNAGDSGLLAGVYLYGLVSSYYGGDWTKNDALRVRWIYRQLTAGLGSVNARATRNVSAFSSSYNLNCSGAEATASLDITFPTAPGTDSAESTPASYFQAWPGYNESSQNLTVYGAWVSAPAKSGVRMCCIAQGGWTTRSHLDPTVDATNGKYSDAELRNFLTLSDAALVDNNIVLIQIGQNTATGETSGSTYYDNVKLILARYRAAYAAIGAPAPTFLLRATWDTNTVATATYDLMEAALYQIARESGDVGFVNLRRLILNAHGAYSTWSGTYLSDGVHQTQSGTEEFERLFWAELANPTPASRPPGSIRCGGIRIGL